MISIVDIVKYAGVGCLTYGFLYKREFLYDIYNNTMILGMYNIIYAISYTQIQISKVVNYIQNNEQIKKYFKSTTDTEEKGTKIELIKDGFSNGVLYDENYILDNPIYSGVEYDFLLFSYKQDNGITYKKILQKCKTEEDLHLELSNIKFILIEIIMGDNIIKIDLSTDKYNYYVVDNIIDKHVIQYINENKLILHDITDYDLKIIDNDANIYILPSDKSIKILKNTYEIL